MRTIRLLAPALATAALALTLTAPADAAIHEVAPGETLSGIAIADGLPVGLLAAANGLPIDAHVIAGSILVIPAAGQAAATTAVAPTATAGEPGEPAGDDGDESATTASASSSAPPALGAYTVRPGDTLGELARRSGVPVEQMAYMNGLRVNDVLLSGTVIKLPTGSPIASSSAATEPSGAVVPAAAPTATPVRLSAAQVGSIAAANGVPASLATAIAWQESGFNNGFVSAANARGIMQILPGTWDYVQSALIPGQRLDPASAADNVRAGSLYLGQLLRETGGDPATAVAGYYQGLKSVQAIGMLPETRRYVANVLALRSQFGG
jgi:N-acetylmuramoyl-L-alanine amidase